MKITIDTNQRFAPGCFLLCQVDEKGEWNIYDEATTKLIQGDWDLPRLAVEFGIGKKHPDMEESVDFLHDTACGTVIEDPGYFSDHKREPDNGPPQGHFV